MSDRKRYSKRRADALWSLIDDAITEFRIAVLKGELSGLSRDGMEERIYARFESLPDTVVQEYRRSYAPLAILKECE